MTLTKQKHLSGHNRNPKVSVIVPNFNYARFLDQRLESITAQTFGDYEIILLDDASTDNSAEVINRWAGHPKVSQVVVNDRNSGSAFSQWDKGIRLAKGDYIWIAEADDLAKPAFLENSVAMLDAFPDMALVKAMSFLIDADGNESDHPPFDHCSEDGLGYAFDGNSYIRCEMLRRNNFYNASTILFRRPAWENITDTSFRNLRFVGDWLLWGLMMQGNQVGEVHRKLNMFRLHGMSQTDRRAISPSRGEAEDEFVKWRLAKCIPETTPMRKVREYRLGKLVRNPAKSETLKEISSISPEMTREILNYRNAPKRRKMIKLLLSFLPDYKLSPLKTLNL